MKNCLLIILCAAILGIIVLSIIHVSRMFVVNEAGRATVSPRFVGCDTEVFLTEGDGSYIIRFDDLQEENN